MAPCDPYSEPDTSKNAHECLISYLDFKEPDVDVSGTVPGQCVLPTEILELMLSYVPSKYDLVQICQASKRFFSIATPVLYRNFHYTVASGTDPVLTNIFTIESIGLRYVRELVLSPGADMNRNQQGIFQLVRMFINHVPVNLLESFSWDSPQPLPADIVKLLWQRHRYLRHVEIFKTGVLGGSRAGMDDGDGNLLAEVNRLPFSELRSVRIVPDTADPLFTACAALQKGVVTQLEIDGRYWQDVETEDSGSDTEEEEDEDEDEADLEDSMTGALFSHLERVKPCRVPLHDTFTRLALRDVNLTDCKRSWFTYLDLCHLKQLTLEHCAGADLFSMKLSNGAATPRLHHLTLVHDLSSQGDRTIYALKDLLTSPRHTLRTLKLSLRNAYELPSDSCMRSHGKTLKRLLLDVSGKNEVQNNGWDNPGAAKYELVYDAAQFGSILRSCSGLQELGIALPGIGLEYVNFDRDGGEFGDRITDIVRHLKLKSLNIINWPRDYETNSHPGYYAAKVPQLARVVSDIFALHRRFDSSTRLFLKNEHECRLEIMTFGIRERSSFAPSPVHFVQSKIFALGKLRFGAAEVRVERLRAQGLHIAILDYKERDFDEQSRKSDGEISRRWSQGPPVGPLDGGWGG